MDGCCRRRLHSGTHIGRNHGPTAVTATVVRRHQNASLNPTRRAGSMRGRSLTLREHGELRTPASGSIDPRALISPIISSSRRHSPRTKLCMRPSYVPVPRGATGLALTRTGRGAARRWGALWRLWLAVCDSGTGLGAVRAQRASKGWWWLRRDSGANRTSRRRASGCPTSAIFGEGDRRAGFCGDLCGCLRAVAPPKGPARPKTTFEPPEPGRLLSGLRGFKMCGCGANNSRRHVSGC